MRHPAPHSAVAGLLAIGALFAAVSPASAATVDKAAIAAAVASTDRPEADSARDANRKPDQVLEFMGVQPGMVVADLMAAGGYYTELLARTVGPTGKVYLHNTPFVLQRFAEKQVQARLAGDRLPNVVRHDAELEDLKFEPGSLDAAFMVLFYHDTYWQGIDRPAMLQQIMRALKPGGFFALIDHSAEPGSKDRDVKTLHRVDEAIVRQEILDAGFELAGTSDALRHPEDDRKTNVFDESLRGMTDRFIYRFSAPSAPRAR
jgi:predicted methyltransferase